MRSLAAQRRVVIVDDSRTIQAILDNAFSKRPEYQVVGFCSDANLAVEMIRRLRPDIVTIDLAMPYIDGATLLNMIGDLKDICKIVVSDLPLKNIHLSAKLVEAGAAACLGKSELVSDPEQFFNKIRIAANGVSSRKRHVNGSDASAADGAITKAGLPFPIPADEPARLRYIRQKNLCNSARERQFDLITSHVAKVTAFPVCLLTFIDRDVQWIKSSSGLDVESTPRDQAFCNYTIAQGGTFVVANATRDDRFATNSLVTDGPGIRCYAGHPVTAGDGIQVGALCVIDTRVRTVGKHVLDQLAGMSAIVGELIDQRPAMAA